MKLRGIHQLALALAFAFAAILITALMFVLPEAGGPRPMVRFIKSRQTPHGPELVFRMENNSGANWSFYGGGPSDPYYLFDMGAGRFECPHDYTWRVPYSSLSPRYFDFPSGKNIEIAVPVRPGAISKVKLQLGFLRCSARKLSILEWIAERGDVFHEAVRSLYKAHVIPKEEGIVIYSDEVTVPAS